MVSSLVEDNGGNAKLGFILKVGPLMFSYYVKQPIEVQAPGACLIIVEC